MKTRLCSAYARGFVYIIMGRPDSNLIHAHSYSHSLETPNSHSNSLTLWPLLVMQATPHTSHVILVWFPLLPSEEWGLDCKNRTASSPLPAKVQSTTTVQEVPVERKYYVSHLPQAWLLDQVNNNNKQVAMTTTLADDNNKNRLSDLCEVHQTGSKGGCWV